MSKAGFVYLLWHTVQCLADVHQHPDQSAHLVLDRADIGLLQSQSQTVELPALIMTCTDESDSEVWQ